jgi:hypothetical protein
LALGFVVRVGVRVRIGVRVGLRVGTGVRARVRVRVVRVRVVAGHHGTILGAGSEGQGHATTRLVRVRDTAGARG